MTKEQFRKALVKANLVRKNGSWELSPYYKDVERRAFLQKTIEKIEFNVLGENVEAGDVDGFVINGEKFVFDAIARQREGDDALLISNEEIELGTKSSKIVGGKKVAIDTTFKLQCKTNIALDNASTLTQVDIFVGTDQVMLTWIDNESLNAYRNSMHTTEDTDSYIRKQFQ